jgi:beta-glucosidase
MKKFFLLFLFFVAGFLGYSQKYLDPKLPVDQRIDDLISRMTLDEKVNQLIMFPGADSTAFDLGGNYIAAFDTSLLNHSVGYFSVDKYGLSVEKQALYANGLQRYLLQHSRLKIPGISLSEGLHGFMAKGATSFPQAIALASTWDTTLVEKVFSVAAMEARNRGSQEFLSPVIDLGREPRWGRFEETYGEDPYLVSRIGLAAVLGFQGRQQTIDNNHVAVTLKHFAGHGQPEGGRNTAPVNYSERLFRETHLYPFEIAVKRGHARSLMASYNEWDEVPNHINKKLLTDILRKEWGFDGYVMSDGGGISMLYQVHKVAATPAEAGKMALEAGVDMELAGDNECFAPLKELAKEGKVNINDIDRAVRGILRVKFELGLFENPYVDVKHCLEITNSKEHKDLAREAAQKSIILLKNEGNLLPLDSNKIKTLAVIGPNAAELHPGGYSAVPHVGTSVLEGMKQFAGNRMRVLYAEGCKITLNKETNWTTGGNPILNDPVNDQKLIAEAVATAQKSDAILLVLGENEITCREAWSDDHLGDRDDLNLVGQQNELAKAILATGKPVVILLLNGRPLTIDYLKEHAPAILLLFIHIFIEIR